MATRPRRRFCCDEDLAFLGYDGLNAAADLDRWRDGKLHPATRELIEVVLREGVQGARLLDIGAGVGAVHVSLLEAGAASAVDVDASREYLATARAEAERRGLDSRVEYRYGDVVELASELPAAEIVTLDSVICCYPYLEPLLAAATRSRPRHVGITWPRDVWWMRAFMRLFNLAQAVRRNPARYFIHRRAQVERWMAGAGYDSIHDGGTREWSVLLYSLRAGPPALLEGDRGTDDELAHTAALVAVVESIDDDRWRHVPQSGVWSIGKDAEHVAEAAIYHQWIVRLTIGQAESSRRPAIERNQVTTDRSPREVAELLHDRSEEGVRLLLDLTEEQLELPTRPPRARGQALAETIERVLIGHYDTHRLEIEAKLR